MKLFNNQSILVAGMVAVAILSSCSKSKLDTVSQTSISDAVAFSTSDRISEQVDGLYATLKSADFYAGRYLIYNDVRGENFLNQTQNGVTAYTIWNFTVTASDTYLNDLWDQAYQTINGVNVFLAGMQNEGNAVVGDSLAKQYDGEAKVVRAICYYSLLQLFATPYNTNQGASPGLPLRLTAITSGGESNSPLSTVAQIYAQVLSDLNDAETELPLNYGDAATNTTHAHRNTAIALKTRVYLSMNDFTDLITEANKIVSANAPFTATTGVPFQLQSDIATVFTTYTTTESILSMPFTGAAESPGGQNSLAQYYLSADLGGTQEYSLNSSGVIADPTWTATDQRRQFIHTYMGLQWLTKYSTPSPYTDWVPVMRYSEVLLNLAEARAKSTNSVDPQAVALLNAVRHRSDASTTYTVSSFSSVTSLVNAILEERNIEFLGEGLRSPDIMRLGLTFPAKGVVQSVSPSQMDYVLPIPTDETLHNTDL